MAGSPFPKSVARKGSSILSFGVGIREIVARSIVNCKLGGMKLARPKRQELMPLAALLAKVRAEAAAKSGCPIDRESWRKLVGGRIAHRSAPDRLQGGTLTVRVATSVWAQELSLLASDLLLRLRQAGYAVDTLRWRVASTEPLRSTRVVQSPVVPLCELPAELERALSRVEDAELKAAIEQAAAYMMARQQQKKARPRY